MKKIVLLAAACICIASCGAFKKIEVNTNIDGVRTIVTTNRHLVGDVSLATGARTTAKDTIVAFLVTSTEDSDHSVFSKGDLMQIKLTDGSVIKLTNVYDKAYEKETETGITNSMHTNYVYDYVYSPWTDGIYVVPYQINQMVPHAYTHTTTFSWALYLVTYPQMQDIINKGVTRVRVENESGFYEVRNPEGFAAIVKEQAINIYEAFVTDPKADIDDF